MGSDVRALESCFCIRQQVEQIILDDGKGLVGWCVGLHKNMILYIHISLVVCWHFWPGLSGFDLYHLTNFLAHGSNLT